MDCNSSQGSTSLSLYKIHYRIFLKWLVSSFRKPRDCWFSSRTCPRIRRILFIRLCPSLLLIYFGFPPLLNPLPPSYHCFPAKLNWSFFDPLRTIPPLLLNLPKKINCLSIGRPILRSKLVGGNGPALTLSDLSVESPLWITKR